MSDPDKTVLGTETPDPGPDQMGGSDGGGVQTPPPGADAARSKPVVALLAGALALIAVVVWYLYSPPVPTTMPDAPMSSREPPATQQHTSDATADSDAAEEYIGDITRRREGAVETAGLDQFITPEQKLRLRDGDTGYAEQKLADMEQDKPLSVLHTQRQVEYRTLAQLKEEHNGDVTAVIELLDDDGLVHTTLGELLQRHADNPDKSLATVVESGHVEHTTAGELRESGAETAKILRERFLPKEATVQDLFGGQIRIQEGTVFYVHTVNADDDQGIWGIIHNGLVDNFATGIAIKRGEDVTRYQVDIPRLADEQTAEHTSSFLGRIIDRKVKESHTYSLKSGRMGRDPDLVHPGEEVLIVNFSRDELKNIYQHFVRRANRPN